MRTPFHQPFSRRRQEGDRRRDHLCLRLPLLVISLCLLLASNHPLQAAPTTQTTPVTFNLVLGWLSPTNDSTLSVAWGDMNGDGALDLAITNAGEPNKVYLNQGGVLQTTPAWSSLTRDFTRSIAWGDMNSDGTLDLAVGNASQPSKVYLNQGGLLQSKPAWSAPTGDNTYSIAWGDMNGDGTLDLAIGNNEQPSKVYLNQGGLLQSTPAWSSPVSETTTSIAWGDMNGDGALDLALGNSGQPSKVYLNQGGMLQSIPAWSSPVSETTTSIAWGDMNGDGALDLALGNSGQPSKVYLNQAGLLQSTPVWSSLASDNTTSIAWGDVNGDGTLDLAIGNNSSAEPGKVYLNQGGMLRTTPAWTAPTNDFTLSIAWGDMNGDGTLDLTLGNYGQFSKVYLNQGGVLQSTPAWSSLASDNTYSIAWGDINGDGTLDLAVGNYGQPSKAYLNQGGMLRTTPAWIAPKNDNTYSIAWGDMNGDGSVDLAVGNYGQPSKVYLNQGGVLQSTPTWSSLASDNTYSIAWGDMNGDGTLDLAVGNYGQPSKVYLNQGGMLQTTPAWTAPKNDTTRSIAWGDMNGDGALDLAIGNFLDLAVVNSNVTSKVYLNQGGVLQSTSVWSSLTKDTTRSIAWGDMNGDGTLDLAVGNTGQPSKVYLNQGGVLQTTPAWSSQTSDTTFSIAWGDINGDGTLDLALGNGTSHPSRVYLNQDGVLQSTPAWSFLANSNTHSIALGDLNGDGTLDLALGNKDQPSEVYLNPLPVHPPYARGLQALVLSHLNDPANFHAQSTFRQSGLISFTYQLFHPNRESMRAVHVYYSLDGSFPADRRLWREAKPAPSTQTTDLATSPFPTVTLTNTHVFSWDVVGSGFFGQSDNVVVRIEALPNLKPLPNGIPGPFQRPYVSAQSFPFRVRGSQVRVVQADDLGQPISGAIVYRLSANQTQDATPFVATNGAPYQTNSQGYLAGRGALVVDDRLIALQTLTATQAYTHYQTSAAVTLNGVDAFTVTQGGVQTLTVSADNPLLLFNLDIALEWDASDDADYQFRLERDIKRTSELLFDFTNGRAALGHVRVFQDAKRYLAQNGTQPWLDADIRVYASNQLHPNATQGGVVANGYLTEALQIDGVASVMTYTAGYVNMGAVWNADGEANDNTGEDWARALAHELGHYLFFLNDSYLGEDEHGYLVPVDSCQYTAMTDPYREDYSEFLFPIDFQPNCRNTLAAKSTGRSDWETIQTFYPALQGTTSNAGPSSLPLAVTQVEFLSVANVLTMTLPTTPTQLLSLPDFYLIDQENRSIRPGSAARAFLYQENQIVELGSPLLDRVKARGVRKNDEVCLYDPLAKRLGCVRATTGNEPLQLVTRPTWQPQLEISPVTSRTIDVRLPLTNTGLSGIEPVQAQLFAENITQTLVVTMIWDANTRLYLGHFQAELPLLAGYVRLWVNENHTPDNPRREVVADYQLGGSPVPRWQHGVPRWQHGVPRWQHGVPASSTNGQVIIYGEALNFPDGEFFTLQTMPSAAQLPAWATLVGQAYRLTTSSGAPGLDGGTSITFQYLGRDVPPGEENFLRIYQYDQTAWRPLTTTLNITYNVASAAINAPGIYALMSSFEIPLVGPQPGSGGGWNNVAYMAQAARPVAEALQSIAGAYTIVWGYEPNPPDGRFWQAFDPALDPTNKFYDLVNNLKQLQFGRGYWIHTTRDITLFLKGDSDVGAANLAVPTAPPALYYGDLWTTADFTPSVGMPVTAWVGDQLCGQGQVATRAEQLVYVVEVAASSAQAGCGGNGQLITFRVNGVPMLLSAAWDNQVTHYLPLTTSLPQQMFFPVVRK